MEDINKILNIVKASKNFETPPRIALRFNETPG